MTIILDNLDPELLEKLQTQAIFQGRTLTEEIKRILINEIQKNKLEIRYNAWGKVLTRESIENTIKEMREFRKSIPIESSKIQEMREEGRRF